ncbi:hypothetical protein G6F37_013280 [Rhizopus arrhizus]|nr:hypothetical protein G6F37_013280 [Rhizopus arrhizus]
MEMVPAEQSVDPSTAHSRGSQRRRRSRVTEDLHQEHLASSTFCIRRDPTTMGPLFGRSIRGSHLPPPTKIRVLDTRSWGDSHRRVHDDLEQLVQPLDQSTMEPDHPSSQQDFTGTASGCHDGGSVLAKCSLVSDDSGDGNFSSSVPVSSAHSDNDTINSMVTTGELDVIRLETLSNKYNNTGLTSTAASLLSTHRTDTNRSTNRSYRFGQNLFMQWALQHQVSLTDFTATDLINFLADLHHHRCCRTATDCN